MEKDIESTTENATQIGSQRATPSSVAKIEAEKKQVERELRLAGEQRNDGEVEAEKNTSVHAWLDNVECSKCGRCYCDCESKY